MENHPYDSHFTDYADLPEEDLRLSLSGPFAVAQSPASPARATSSALPHEFEHHANSGSRMEDAQMLIQDGYQSSGSSTRHSSGNLGAYLDEDPACMSSGGSSRSSISSIPASVYTNLAEGMKPTTAGHDHGHSHPWDAHDRLDGGTLRPISANKLRQAAFRKPSSVKAMQMHTEDERDDDAFLTTPPKRRAGHQRYSDVSIRSVGSSSLRKSQSYSPTGSGAARKQRKEENEYPLVLLHCNLLPPSLPVPGAAAYHNQKILSEVLPPVFWRRWKLLEEKVGSQVLRERGVLISHPEDMYDLLEERLLESLELQRPRLDHGHFIGHDETESEKEDRSEKEESATDEEEGEPCPDCSGHVIRHGNAGRKWEIKVFAANGLMRAGAWAAAWREMEKVDVEVGLWLPSEVRRELEKRLMGEDYYSCHLEPQLQVPQLQVPGSNPVIHARPEARHARTSSSNTVDQRSFSFEEIKTPSSPAVDKSTPVEQQQPPKTVFSPLSADDIDIHTLLVNYLRVLASDRRNVTIAILSVLVVFFAIQSGSHVNSSALRPFPQDLMEAESLSIPVSSTKQIESVTSHSPTACVSQAAQSATTDIIIGEVPMSVSEVPDSTSGSISSAVMYAAVAESVPAFAGDISESLSTSVLLAPLLEPAAYGIHPSASDISESASMRSQSVVLAEPAAPLVISEPDMSHHESHASYRIEKPLILSQAEEKPSRSLFTAVESSVGPIALVESQTPIVDSLNPIMDQLLGK